jgi:hypothetical protein
LTCPALAAIAGNLIGAFTSNLDQKFFILLLIGAGAIVIVSLPTLFFAKEEQRVLQEGGAFFPLRSSEATGYSNWLRCIDSSVIM